MSNGRNTHGMTGTRFYRIWCGMKRRCYNKNEVNYSRYGGAGVVICDKWHIFTNFMEDMHDSYSKGLSIDRIDSAKGYSFHNCRWATTKQQANNKINVLNYKGKNFSDWDKVLGFKHGTTRARVKSYGWSIEKATTAPKDSHKLKN